MNIDTKHKPVLLNEMINSLNVKSDDVIVDCTLGGGGHLKKILENSNNIKVYAFDIDASAIERFETYLEEKRLKQVTIIKSNFKNLKSELNLLGVNKVDKVYADLGFSTDQIEWLSFKNEGELDLRMDKTLQVKASDLINALHKRELIKLFEEYGDIKNANEMVNLIIKNREHKPINTKQELIQIISKLNQKEIEQQVFQALRIAVNLELENLKKLLEEGFELLDINGRMAIISFHSGEDRIVKHFMKDRIREGKAKWIEELIVPSNDEIRQNNKSRSAKLRVIEKQS